MAKKKPSATSKAKKISITVDDRVLRGVVREAHRAGRTLSAQITEALARDLRQARLRELIREYEAEHGEISEEELAGFRAECQE